MNILSFGEPILINYLDSGKLSNNSKSIFDLGGSEIRTLVSLSNLGNSTYLLSVFPCNELSNEFINVLKDNKINTDLVIKSEDELIGSVYVKNKKYYYQNDYSAFSKINVININFTKIFQYNYNWIHLTGVSSLISSNTKIIFNELIRLGIDKNIKISFNFNHRPSLHVIDVLWKIIKKIINKFEIFQISSTDLYKIFKLENINLSNIDDSLLEFCRKFSIKKCLINFKEESESLNIVHSVLVIDNKIYKSELKEYCSFRSFNYDDIYISYIINNFEDDNITKLLNDATEYTIKNLIN